MTDTERALIQLWIATWQVGWQLFVERANAMSEITASVAAAPRFYAPPAGEPDRPTAH